MNLRYFYLLLLIFIGPKPVFSQPPTPPKFVWIDRHCKCPEFEFVDGKFRLKRLLDTKNEIEIRLYANNYGAARTITVLSVKNDSVQGFYYNQEDDLTGFQKPDSVKGVQIWERHPFKKFTIVRPDLKTTLAEMIYYNLLRLPDQKTLMKGEPFGTKYILMFKYYDHVRSYGFDDTTELVEKHPEIPEFAEYLSILKLFKKITVDYEKTTFRNN